MVDVQTKLIRKWTRQLQRGKGAPEFFEMVRCIEQQHPELPRIGSAPNEAQTPVRFGQVPYLKFPGGELADIKPSHGIAEVPLILEYFFGMMGGNGPQPLEFTSYIYRRSHNYYDRTLQRFLDIIHHRTLELFYRAWRMSEESVSFDRPDDDSIGDMIQGISGESELFNDAENSALPQYFGRAFIPLKASTIRNRFGLEAILRSFFRMPINVYDFEMGEYDLPARFRNVSGHSNITLGQNFQIGSRYHSLSEKIRIVIGPIKFSDAKYLMPGGKGFDQFAEIINRYLDRPLKYDVDFDIVPESIPESSFAQPLQQGRSFWVGTSAPKEKSVHQFLYYSELVQYEKKRKDEFNR